MVRGVAAVHVGAVRAEGDQRETVRKVHVAVAPLAAADVVLDHHVAPGFERLLRLRVEIIL